MTAGYSGTPLAKKLGLKAGMDLWAYAMPDSVRAEIDPEAAGVQMVPEPAAGLAAAHLFVTERATLAPLLERLRPLLAPAGMIWVSWPKKAARVPTDLTEDVLREIALPMGYVDVKVCAVDAIWSGLKFVIRRTNR